MVEDIDIQPSAAKDAGCSAIAGLEDSSAYGSDWWKLWRFDATAVGEWTFDHWAISYTLIEEGPEGQSGSFSDYPKGSPRFEDEYYYDWSYISGYGIWSKTITAVAAVFKRQSSGLILRSATTGRILRTSGGTILRDD